MLGDGRCSKGVVDIDRGEDMPFPGQREEGAGDEGACLHGGELFVVFCKAVDDEPVNVERDNRRLYVRHTLDGCLIYKSSFLQALVSCLEQAQI